MTEVPPADADRTLDVREIDGPPFEAIVATLEDLDAGESLLLINSFEPAPLYDVLDERGFDHRTSQVGPEEWHVRIEPA